MCTIEKLLGLMFSKEDENRVGYQDCTVQSNDDNEKPILSIGIDCEFAVQSDSDDWCHNYNLSREQLVMFLTTCLTLFSDEDVKWLLAFNQHLGESRKEYNLEEFTKMFNERVEFAEDPKPNPVYLNFMKGLY